jgi:hypothetical protein
MATWASLTPQQQATVQATVNLLRPYLGALSHELNTANDIGIQYGAGSQAIVATLAGTEIIPNTSGLAGAQDLTQSQFMSLITVLLTIGATANGATGSYNTPFYRNLYMLAAGINAVSE